MSYSRRSQLTKGSDALDLRRRALKRDDAIRRRIENDLSKKKRALKKLTKHRKAVPGTVLSLRPLEPVMCKKHITAFEASQLMAARRENCVLVVDDNDSLIGIFTAKDLAFRIAGAGKVAGTVTIEEIMTPNPTCAQSQDPASEALTLMVERGFRHLPVLDEEGHIDGVLDITKCYSQQMERLERMHDSLKKLYEALDNVQLEMGSAQQPLHVFQYFEELKTKMNGPTLELVVGADTVPIFCSVRLTVYDATVMMKENKTTAVLVKDSQGAVSGIFTSKDVVLRVIAAGLDPKTCLVVRVMTPQPDVLKLQTPIQQALRQMFDGHYLNLPIVGDDANDIIAIIDVLKLTYATLNQIKQIEQVETDSQSQNFELEGPAWNKFWTLYDSTIPTDDLDSVHSDPVVCTPEVTPLEFQHFNLDIQPLDLISGVEIKQTPRRSLIGSHASVIPEDELEQMQFIFKFKSPGDHGRVHRINTRPVEGVTKLRDQLVAKLTEEELEAMGGKAFAVSYIDDEGDVVLITSDSDLIECARINWRLNREKADLYLHHPSAPARPKPAKLEQAQWINGISNELVLSVAGVVAGSAILGWFLSKK